MKFKKSCKVNVGLLFKYQRVIFEKESKPRVSTTSKYVCPMCELSFKAKKGLYLFCGDCKRELREIED